MKKSTVFNPAKFLFFFFFLSQVCVAQLSNFSLAVTLTNETCTANGSLSFTTSGTTSGATMLYSIYLLPNTTTPLATISGNTYGGLVAGNYRVVATQSLGAQSGTQQQDVTILNQIAPLLTYQLVGQNSSTCINNGQIVVNVTSGNAVSYEIFAGPIIKPLQPSNIFTGLSAGVYQIRVFDACGEGVVQTYTLTASPASLQISTQIFNPPLTCGSVLANHIFSAPVGSAIAYPLNVVVTVFPPTGPSIVYNQTITSGDPNTQSFSQSITLFPNQNYSYNIVVTDACGTVRSRNGNNVNSNITPTATPTSQIMNCVTLGSIFIRVVQTVILVAAPAAYTNTLPYNYTSTIGLGSAQINNLPVGTYTFNVTDVCGNPHVLQVTIQPSQPMPIWFNTLAGCGPTTGSINISSPNGTMVSIFMTQAPSTYTSPLPHDVSFNIEPLGNFFIMNTLPVGTYGFHFTDSCGNQYDVSATINGMQFLVNDFLLTPNCNSFNLEVHHTNNTGITNSFLGLQKFNPITGQWGHPGTGVVYVPGSPITVLNSRILTNNSINTNLAYSGSFRVILEHAVYGNGANGQSAELCHTVLYEFDFNSLPDIIDVYSFLCSNNTFQVVVNATGLGPLLYRITSMNGMPFVLENGTSNIFLGLQPAIYNFQVEDVCGNILNSLHDISNPIGFQITPSNFCAGQPASLSVPNFSFLTYQWWEASAPTVILSTTSQLQFPSFSNSDQGTYFVSIVHLINATCINQTQTYLVNPNQNNPNAGIDGTTSFCGSQASIDLFTFLSGNYDTNGTWSAVTPGVTLSNNIWNATGVAAGVYQFKYTVTGSCNAFDESFVTITLQSVPQAPTATATTLVCDNQNLALFATFIPNATYQWSGPNGFTSTLQNPIITTASSLNSGTYSVQALQNGCASPQASVTVSVAPLPQFALAFDCVDNNAVLEATPTQNSFVASTATYQWSNNQGFTSSDNPVTITGEAPGIYNLVVTNAEGCTNTNTINVATSLCSIPNGISPNNDGLNDAFDLSGFNGVQTLKIFNRYGMVVFEQENYVKDWIGQDKKGNLLPSATYYYMVALENGDTKTGWVYLLRENN